MKYLSLLVLFIFFTTRCNNAGKQEMAKTGASSITLNIKGNWVNMDFIEHAEAQIDSNILNDTYYYCTEIIFDHSDSALFANAFEEYYMRFYCISPDKIAFRNMVQDKGGMIRFTSDSTLLLTDSSETDLRTGKPVFQLFKKTQAPANEKYAFSRTLGAKLISGKYLFSDPENSAAVYFNPDNIVKGLGDYKKYELCYGGDCAGELNETRKMSVLSLESEKGADYYAYTIDKKTGILSIYELSKPVPDIKGNRTIGKKKWELVNYLSLTEKRYY